MTSLYFLVGIYIVAGLFYLIVYRKEFEKGRFISLMADIVFLVIAVCLQFVYPYLIVEMFAQTMGLLFIILMIQKPEDRLDTDTGISKLSAFVETLNRSKMNSKPERIIMVNMVNYKAVRDTLGYEETRILKRKRQRIFLPKPSKAPRAKDRNMRKILRKRENEYIQCRT